MVLVVKNPTSVGDIKRHGFNPWVGKIPEGVNDNSLQYSFLGNPMERGARQAIVHGITRELDIAQ